MKGLHTVTWILLIVGGLNWGLEGALNWGVKDILGSKVSMIIYILVGLSAIFELINHKNTCKECVKGGAAPMGQM